ncbi:hypothetical protein Zm00014a_011918 [Zea mays]|uniref:Uncharacterized protein n=1 Tax=Zea mays TaxID=4577 RepID=A0A3L6D714_MAIZE|nr:hypothetical protein Zm00014a_011918 [Zea mays]
MTPASPVRDRPGFSPRKIALGMRAHQQGEAAPMGALSPRLLPKSPKHSVWSKPRDTTSCLVVAADAIVPHNDEDFGACRHHNPALVRATSRRCCKKTRGVPLQPLQARTARGVGTQPRPSST